MWLPMKNLIAPSNTIDTIVFDFDGTQANTLPSSRTAFTATLEKFNIANTLPASIKTYGPLSVADMFRIGGVKEDELLYDMVRQYHRLYQNTAPRQAALFKDVRRTLNRLKGNGYRLAIATNESRENLDLLMKAFPIKRPARSAPSHGGQPRKNTPELTPSLVCGNLY